MCINLRGNWKSSKYYTAKKKKGPKPKTMTPCSAFGGYLTHERPNAENTLAGHVPIEISFLFTFFLQTNADNLFTATVIQGRARRRLVMIHQ